ncbi:MAG: dockerin type I repeat-containing protein, partial [Oscillospiraceae bacterium]|nr:dockerin type I repeat-containing protein [Oscillospiraceae bacterium]
NDPVLGDCNADGEFSVADVVLLQKWLLKKEKSMPDWKAADLCEDDRLNIFDLCMMKQMLLNS